ERQGLQDVVAQLAGAGKSVVVIGVDHAPIAVIALADTLRPHAPGAIAELKQLGIRHTVMLSGDRAPVAAAIARQVGIDEYFGDLLPHDKLEIVRKLQSRHGPLAMIGDGVNDAPAMAAASVGIAMGGAGSDVAIESAD